MELSLRWFALALIIGVGWLLFDKFMQNMKRGM